MGNKVIASLAATVFVFVASGVVFATVTTSSGYNAVTYDDSISFSAVVQNDGSVKSTWSKYTGPEDFTYYKLVRSDSNSNPVYPDDGYIYYGGNIDSLSYIDSDVSTGAHYYRICQIASPERYCSKTVVKVDIGAGIQTTVEEKPIPILYNEVPKVTTIEGFSDVPTDHWAASCVEKLASLGVIESGDGVAFRINDPVNRAEFLKMVMSIYYPGADKYLSETCFNDVATSSWYAPYVCSAKVNDIASGYPDNTFRPTNSITRAEGAALLIKALKIALDDVPASPFLDVYIAWQKEAVDLAYKKGLVSGYSEYEFRPNGTLTRAEAAKMICNAKERFSEPLAVYIAPEEAKANPEPVVEPEIPSEPVSSPDTVVGSVHRTSPLIINHNNANIDSIPESIINTAKSTFRIAYGHTSHGSQLTSGMTTLRAQNSLYDYNAGGTNGALYYNESLVYGDLGGDWEIQTRDLLGSNDSINMVMWSWCGQMSDMSADEVNDYLSAMDALESDYPGVIFVYMTGHLDGSGEAGTLHRNNEMVRDFARNYNKVLFDFADIESYNPNGSYFLNMGADDNNDYSEGNWATLWCSANAGSPLCSDVSCAHSQSLNCNLKGRAFWYMMARLAGWGG